jgi:hypothetical protein
MPEPEKQVAVRERSFSGSYRSTLEIVKRAQVLSEPHTSTTAKAIVPVPEGYLVIQ